MRRAEAGDDVILTRYGQAKVRLVPIKSTPDARSHRRVLMERLRAWRPLRRGPSAAHSQDFLYSEDGLPE
ncbi:MAG: type II toxin-antitoxin system prevent-host-death family antitoxin [Chromatiales bacterium]|nr:type II toxin-antitoxin system prevent-host-death family antitoxin [Chromatiales bacterium]MCK7582301.1 type II toxin-antitoxin system prevent-host-death family antitoxin [Chromatiales bacterium]